MQLEEASHDRPEDTSCAVNEATAATQMNTRAAVECNSLKGLIGNTMAYAGGFELWSPNLRLRYPLFQGCMEGINVPQGFCIPISGFP